MTKGTIFGGYLIDVDGYRNQLPTVLNPSISVIETIVKTVATARKGVVTLQLNPPTEIGPDKLEMYVDAGNLLLMLGIREDNDDYSVRTPTNENMPNSLVVVLGESYPAKAVIYDAGFACAVFKEFACTGNVSMRLLQ